MIHDRTLLYSATAATSTITLSEPLSAFERYMVKATSPNVYYESVCTGNRSVQRFNRYGSYNNDGYMVWPANWVISNDTKTLTCNRFQLLMQLGTTTKVQTFGWNNTAGNIKNISEVWGINRIGGTTAQGEGSPGEGWKTYNETLLWSGIDYANQSHITLNNRAIGYERLKVGVGSFGESTNILETDSPQNYTAWLPLTSYWGTTTGSFYLSMHRYRWDDETSGLSAVSGKTWQLGTGAANPYSTTGNYTATDTFVRRPVWAIWGINEKPKQKFIATTTEAGTVSASKSSGYSGDVATLTAIPASEDWKCSAIDITGATLTGNDFMFGNSNVTASAGFEHSRELTLENGDHGVLSADKMTGFSGDVVTVDATTDEGWYLSAIALTGAEATGFTFMFTGSDVTAQGEYTDQGFPITYENDGHGTLTGDPIYIPGSTGVTLQTAYDTYYRFSGYEITGGTIENNVLVATGPCTARAVYKVNAFTATGNFEKGSNVHCESKGTVTNNANVPAGYATHNAHTGNVPAEWYSTSNRWKPDGASAYTIRLMPKMTFTLKADESSDYARVTACSLIGSTQTQTAAYSKNAGSQTSTYSKDFTSTTQNVNYGISAKLQTTAHRGTTIMGAWVDFWASADYIATATTGTWSATGYAP